MLVGMSMTNGVTWSFEHVLQMASFCLGEGGGLEVAGANYCRDNIGCCLGRVGEFTSRSNLCSVFLSPLLSQLPTKQPNDPL